MAPKPIPNGTAEAPINVSPIPPVVGINFGNSYASIAVFTKEGSAECIANEDGERQIACAISFHGEEIYIGNQAKPQLIKNSKNTITGFRNLLGKRFSEISQSQPTSSAPVIQHPDLPDEPAYKVQVLQPAPTPLPRSTNVSSYNTPLASHAATPRSEPIPAERILTVSEVATLFIKSLIQSAEDFLGRKIQGAVITVPSWFTDAQKDALERVATEAGVKVLQLLEEAGAAAATTTADRWTTNDLPDRTQLVVDLGSSSLSLSLLSIRDGLAHVLASSSSADIGGDQIDDKLIKFFATDFTKKTKTPLAVCPPINAPDQRAEAKLRLAVEHTKRTLSASPGAATCSVESLKDGADFTGSINRMRFDLLSKPIYTAVSTAIDALLSQSGIDAYQVDEIVYVGGTACLPGLDEHICISCGFQMNVETAFSSGTVIGGGIGDPTTVLARGCAAQAALIASIGDDEPELRGAFARDTKTNVIQATSRTIGVILPGSPGDEQLGGFWIPVLFKETALPARRAVSFDVALTDASKKIAFEVWEAEESIRVEKETPPQADTSDDEDEEEEEVEVKHMSVSKVAYLGCITLDALLGIKAKGKSKDAGKWSTVVQVQVAVGADRAVEVVVKEVGGDGAAGSLKIS